MRGESGKNEFSFLQFQFASSPLENQQNTRDEAEFPVCHTKSHLELLFHYQQLTSSRGKERETAENN